MKTSYASILLTAGTLWAGCASSPPGMVLQPVGPPPAPVAEVSTEGSLMVYTAYDVNAPGIGDYEHRRHYTDYKILTQDGKLLRTVHNDVGSVARQVARVDLPEGTYHVVAKANGFGTVTIPVVIAAHQLTVVHLEGGAAWPEMSAENRANAVRLPDGEIVGWRAAADSTRSP